MLCTLAASLSLLFGRELRRRAALEADLARLSMTDALTGVPNRRRLDEELPRVWGAARRSGRPVAMLIVDADHFKRFNDRYGHAVGDVVLQGLGRALSASVHRPADLVCRYGGEEFAVLLPDTDAAGAHRIADRIHAEVAAMTVAEAGLGAGAVTVSIGLACSSEPSIADSGEMTRQADTALYAAKAAGRNTTRGTLQPALGSDRERRALRIVHG